MDYDEALERIENLQGVDPGMFLVASHAFIEMVANKELGINYDSRGYTEGDTSFGQKLWQLMAFIRQNNPQSPTLDVARYRAEHRLTNGIRHFFLQASPEEARAGIQNLLKYCLVLNITSPVLQKLSLSLEIWTNRMPVDQLKNQVSALNTMNVVLIRELNEYKDRQHDYEGMEKKIRELEVSAERMKHEMADFEQRRSTKSQRYNDMRQERFQMLQDLKQKEQQLGDLGRQYAKIREQTQKKVQGLLRMSSLTRTRRDFEQSILRLSREQAFAVTKVQEGKNYLVRGSAGTGKTVVLLEALRQSVSQPGLFAQHKPFALLTFVNTLVRYNRYMGDILNILNPRVTIQTVDKAIGEYFSEHHPDDRLVYGKENVFTTMEYIDAPEFLSQDELFTEIDGFLWGYGISREEYIDDLIPRRGLKVPLKKDQRKRVWEYAEELAEQLENLGMVPRNLAVHRLVLELEEKKQRGQDTAKYQTIFVDEVQDLSPGVLKLLSLLSGNLVMAGDAAQGIYSVQSPFARAGIDIQGKVTNLTMNFRNTGPMIELAEHYLELLQSPEIGSVSGQPPTNQSPIVFRDGPAIGYIRDTTENLKGALGVRLTFFLDDLEYEPESLGILVPTNAHLESVSRYINDVLQIPVTAIQNRDFDFKTTPGIRISTIQSAKGLDFPVTFLFLPQLWVQDNLDPESQRKLKGNLLYVAMTRALDHLEVFVSMDFGQQEDSPEQCFIRAMEMGVKRDAERGIKSD